jgi:hypothetical protein
MVHICDFRRNKPAKTESSRESVGFVSASTYEGGLFLSTSHPSPLPSTKSLPCQAKERARQLGSRQDTLIASTTSDLQAVEAADSLIELSGATLFDGDRVKEVVNPQSKIPMFRPPHHPPIHSQVLRNGDTVRALAPHMIRTSMRPSHPSASQRKRGPPSADERSGDSRHGHSIGSRAKASATMRHGEASPSQPDAHLPRTASGASAGPALHYSTADKGPPPAIHSLLSNPPPAAAAPYPRTESGPLDATYATVSLPPPAPAAAPAVSSGGGGSAYTDHTATGGGSSAYTGYFSAAAAGDSGWRSAASGAAEPPADPLIRRFREIRRLRATAAGDGGEKTVRGAARRPPRPGPIRSPVAQPPRPNPSIPSHRSIFRAAARLSGSFGCSGSGRSAPLTLRSFPRPPQAREGAAYDPVPATRRCEIVFFVEITHKTFLSMLLCRCKISEIIFVRPCGSTCSICTLHYEQYTQYYTTV